MTTRNLPVGRSSVNPCRERRVRLPAVLLGVLLLCWPQGMLAAYQQWDLAADVKSRFSTGCSSVQELMSQAEARGLDGLLFGDHDHRSIQYGLPYVERIVRIKMGSPSLLDNGAATYLSEINQIDKTDDTLVLVPGVESSPFYYWTGNPLDHNLVAHDWDKHLLILGLPNSRDYEELPTLNSSFTTRYLKDDYFLFTVFCIGALIGFYGFITRRRRGWSFVLTAGMILLAANHHPFKSSPFDQYQGDQGVAPYQYLIDYADSKGALVFWNHLETPVHEELDGGLIRVKTRTERHPQDLLLTKHYTGFQVLGDAPISAVEPGKEWDQVLNQYLKGVRDRPVWGYGPNDFRCEGKNGDRLGEIRTVVLTSRKNRPALVKAIGSGRMYAVKQGEGESRLSLDSFELVDPASGKRAVMGEELNASGSPGIHFKLSVTGGTSDVRARIRLIHNSQLVKEGLLKLPYEGVWQNPTLARRGYYRLLVEIDDFNQLVSNPIFFETDHSQETELASINTEVTQPPTPKDKAPVSAEKYVVVTGRGVRLRKGPSIQFPVVGKLNRGERLLLVRRTNVIWNGKPWVVIRNKGDLAYVWEGLIRELPVDQRN